MKRKQVLLTVAILGMLFQCGCGTPNNAAPQEAIRTAEPIVETAETDRPEPTPEPVDAPDEEAEDEKITEQEIEENNTMIITIGEYAFTVSLEDNETAAALQEHLPMTLDMSELNGNETYNYLPFSLPTDSYSPGTIQTGDIMLFGDSCLVVFYKSFSTSYSYTRIGHIDDPTNLRNAVGTGGVQMVLERKGQDG